MGVGAFGFDEGLVLEFGEEVEGGEGGFGGLEVRVGSGAFEGGFAGDAVAVDAFDYYFVVRRGG